MGGGCSLGKGAQGHSRDPLYDRSVCTGCGGNYRCCQRLWANQHTVYGNHTHQAPSQVTSLTSMAIPQAGTGLMGRKEKITSSDAQTRTSRRILCISRNHSCRSNCGVNYFTTLTKRPTERKSIRHEMGCSHYDHVSSYTGRTTIGSAS